MTMSYLESPPGFRNIQGTDYLNTMPGMDLPDQRVNLDIETFIRCVPLGFFPLISAPPADASVSGPGLLEGSSLQLPCQVEE